MEELNYKFSSAIDFKRSLDQALKEKLSETEYNLSMKIQALENLNPKKVLERGFAKIESRGRNISSIKAISVKDDLEIYLKDGKIVAQTISLEEK